MKKTFDEIIAVVKTICDSVSAFAYNDLNIPEDEQYHKEYKEFNDYGAKRPGDRKSAEYTLWEKTYNAMPRPWDNLRTRYLQSLDIEFHEVDSYGGEGQGETWYIVYYFPKHDVYIRIDGYYQSYNGTEFYDGWGCCKEVKPVKKTITVYE